jgi:hypothetical protein
MSERASSKDEGIVDIVTTNAATIMIAEKAADLIRSGLKRHESAGALHAALKENQSS